MTDHECEFGKAPITCMFHALGNQLSRSLQGSQGSHNQLSVGFNGGDIPILPFGAITICVLLGIILRIVFGRARFMHKALSSAPARCAIFFACMAFLVGVAKSAHWQKFERKPGSRARQFLSSAPRCITVGEKAMKEKDVAQGPNFLPVTTLVTGGPYAYTRYAPDHAAIHRRVS